MPVARRPAGRMGVMSNILQSCLFVFCGGGLGSLVRYAVGLSAANLLGKGFPWGTLIVNVCGCFLVGIVSSLVISLEAGQPETLSNSIRAQIGFWQKGVVVGFLGGFTTFSSFGGDTMSELHAGNVRVALANVLANVLLSLLAVWCGMALMHSMKR
jgi:fluoride exporter